MSIERIQRLEHMSEQHQKDLSSVVSSTNRLADQIEQTNRLIYESMLRDERFDAKVERVEITLNARLNDVHGATKRAHERLDEIRAITKKAIGLVLTFILLGVLGAVVKFGV